MKYSEKCQRLHDKIKLQREALEKLYREVGEDNSLFKFQAALADATNSLLPIEKAIIDDQYAKRKAVPRELSDKVISAGRLVEEVLEYDGSGGLLHIVIEDDNVADHWIDSCRESIKAEADKRGGFDDSLTAQLLAADALLGLSESEREQACDFAHDNNYFTYEEEDDDDPRAP